MNITFLIGNGFDLNLGLKTDYKSFYSYYKMRSKSNIAKSIDSEYELWSDLEKGLGEYTARLKTQQDVEKFLDEKEELENQQSTAAGIHSNTPDSAKDKKRSKKGKK